MNPIGQRSDVSQNGSAFAAARTTAWVYDSLGQIIKADSTVPGLDRAYQYDLISATVNATTTTYRYDAQSRRITRTTCTNSTVHVYDGWNPIAEYSTPDLQTFTLTKTYTWGMDLSGSMQGAGGVGGLLAVTDSTGSYYPTYDGNGNVSEYLDSSGAVAAHYEYDTFGNTLVSTGPKVADFAHRFSTKPLDGETGIYFYGYRYYDPVTARWPSRDPIQAQGGINLYGFVGNDSSNKNDTQASHSRVIRGGSC